MATYLKKNILPLLWFIAWIIIMPFAYPALSTQINVYANLVFYIGLLLLIDISQKRLFFSEEVHSLKIGRTWLHILLTLLGLALTYGLATGIISLFPNVATGWGKMKCNSGWSVAAFAVSTIIMPPISEELFFRKSLIVNNGTNRILIATSAVSVILFGLEHSLLPLGFIEGALIGIVFTVAYIRTKNIIVPVIAHFITNFIINGISVFTLFSALRY